MAGKVFFSMTMSLDGFIAPDGVPVEFVFSPEGQNDPRARHWMTKWSQLQAWLFPQRWFRENLKLGESGEEGLDNDIARATYDRTGASVMGKRMFDGGELAWPDEAPFHTPVFVVTHTKRDPCERLDARPDEIVFLDDVERNIAAAAAFGINAVFYQNNAQAMADIEALLCAEV